MTLRHISRWTDSSSQRCAADVNRSGFDITLPNRARLRLDEQYFPVDWSPQFPSDNASTRLWHRSLTYLPALSELPGGWPMITRILEDFSGFISGSGGTVRVPSMDHALAVQIRVCHDLLERSDFEGLPNSDVMSLVTDLLPHLLRLAREPGVRVPNNHGVMLSVSLLLIAVHHPELVSDEDATNDAQIAIEQMETIFDHDGLSNENTASYQGLYVRLLKDLCELAGVSSRHAHAAQSFRQRYELASMAYQRLLLPDGHVPPLGDGGMGMEPRLTPAHGKFLSPPNGLYIHNTSDSYISVVCGARSSVHKQMDDTSIMMWTAGRLLVLDAGVQNYDAANIQAARIRTQPGHSGLFFPKFDDQPLKFFNSGGDNGGRRVDASMTINQDGPEDHILCEYTLNQHRALREIHTASPNAATITDQAWSPDGAPAVARFLLDGSLRLTSAIGQLEGSDGAVWVRLSFSASTKCEITSGLISWSLSERRQCWVIEIPVPAGGRRNKIMIETGSEASPNAAPA